jgi:hypothetical protein
MRPSMSSATNVSELVSVNLFESIMLSRSDRIAFAILLVFLNIVDQHVINHLFDIGL